MNDSKGWLLSIGVQELLANVYRRTTHGQAALLALAMFAVFPALFAQTPITNGYRDFNYGSTVFEAPTADKPQSKLWWNDGVWWGVLWNPSVNKYRIHRFDLAAQSWIDVGPDIDDRSQSLADALWDGQKLYVASHIYSGGSQTSGKASAANSARLYRYSYNAATDAYSLDTGFPVLINSAICEALVIDKDSTGKLWATWTQSSKVYLNRSLGDDLTWGTPFALPTQGSNLSSDDISTLIPYNGKIGVVWSNQSDAKIYFALHHDNKADTDWEPREVALSDPSLGSSLVDDHLNIKMTSDGGGNLYVATKTSLSGSSAPGIYLLKRSLAGEWTSYVVATKAQDYTRPVVVIDDENRELYVIGKNGSNIYKKKVSLDNINFPPGDGDPFIRSSGADINDATVSKHNVNGTTGLLVLASDEVKRYYYHNYLALPSNGPAMISSFSPASGPAGTLVTITGANFNSVSSVKFNGAAATSFTINSSTQITATVPAGATSGKISVTKTNGTAFSANNFTVTTPVQYALTVNVAGFGSVNPSGGFYDSGAMVTLTATPDAGYQFSGWSGDLTGSTNPATITMDGNKNITATFAPSNAGGGSQVAFEESQTGSSSKAITVATSADLIGVNGQLYLAAISTKDKVAVTGVAGLGLSWTLVKAQCAGRNNTGVEVWMAQGAPSGNGAVTATLASKPSYAVIAVSRYSSVDAVNPLGNIFSGNTNGVNGACSGGSDTKSYSFNLAATAPGARIYGAAAMRDRSHTPGAGYTERAEIRKSSASVAVQDQSVAAAGAVILNGTFSGDADWAVIGLEIKPSSGGVVTQYALTTNVVGAGILSPASGTYDSGTEVTLTATPDAGYQFAGWSGDLSGATNPATITMDADKNVIATFTALPPTQYSLTVNVVGSGSVSPSNGSHNAGASVMLTATPASGYQFAGWSGDLSGATNPTTITMDGNKNVTATFTEIPVGGSIVHEESQTGGSIGSATVTTSASLTGVSGHLYLAAISMQPRVGVVAVSGLGLNWTLVRKQCAALNSTGVEVWMAQGTPSGNDVISATLASAPSAAVIAVSRYSGVAAANPIGNVISGNTNGMNTNATCAGGTPSDSYSFNLTTQATNLVIYSAAAMKARTHTPGAGYTERAEIKQTGNGVTSSVAVEDTAVAAAGTVTVNGSFNGTADWAEVALAIKPQSGVSKSAAGAPVTVDSPQPANFQLEQNYPNPFSQIPRFAGNPGTSISYSLPQAVEVQLTIYNIYGQTVSVPVNGLQNAGTYVVDWQAVDAQGRPLPSGVYFYRLEAGSFMVTRRMTLVR